MDQMTPHEGRVAEAILAVVDLASRVLTATPGSHYQWDKTHGLIEAANRLQQLGYGTKQKAVRGDLVTAWVARDAHHHAIGRALFPGDEHVAALPAGHYLNDPASPQCAVCGRRYAPSEARAGFTTCERCPRYVAGRP